MIFSSIKVFRKSWMSHFTKHKTESDGSKTFSNELDSVWNRNKHSFYRIFCKTIFAIYFRRISFFFQQKKNEKRQKLFSEPSRVAIWDFCVFSSLKRKSQTNVCSMKFTTLNYTNITFKIFLVKRNEWLRLIFSNINFRSSRTSFWLYDVQTQISCIRFSYYCGRKTFSDYCIDKMRMNNDLNKKRNSKKSFISFLQSYSMLIGEYFRRFQRHCEFHVSRQKWI